MHDSRPRRAMVGGAGSCIGGTAVPTTERYVVGSIDGGAVVLGIDGSDRGRLAVTGAAEEGASGARERRS